YVSPYASLPSAAHGTTARPTLGVGEQFPGETWPCPLGRGLLVFAHHPQGALVLQIHPGGGADRLGHPGERHDGQQVVLGIAGFHVIVAVAPGAVFLSRRKPVCMRAGRSDARTDPSSRTTYPCLAPRVCWRSAVRAI